MMRASYTTALCFESAHCRLAAAVRIFSFPCARRRHSAQLLNWSSFKASTMPKRNNRLAAARVHIGGLGRIGSNIALALHAAGIADISCNDPQLFEAEQLPSAVYARRSDFGRPKVQVLERFLAGRENITVFPVCAANESSEVRPYLERADLIVSCANQLDARLYLERAAVEMSKPIVQAAVQDGREGPSGLISLWAPHANCCCFGCLVPAQIPKFRRGELLFPTVTQTIAAVSAHLIKSVLSEVPRQIALEHNIFALD